MRVLSFFAKFAFVSLLLGVFIYVGLGRILLTVSTEQLEKDIWWMTTEAALYTETDIGSLENKRWDRLGLGDQPKVSFDTVCTQAPGASLSSRPIAIQLRFTKENAYTIELLCSLIEATPIELKNSTLGTYVHRAVGESGISLSLTEKISEQEQLLVLESIGRQKQYLIEDGNFSAFLAPTVSVLDESLVLDPVPQTSCEATGFTCCNAQAEAGVGTLFSTVVDCPESCYRRCEPIPFIQAFVSEPYPQEDQTIVMTGPTLDALFSYTAVSEQDPIAAVTIDYGDGSTDTATQGVGIFTHTYTCPGPCSYRVRITVTDTKGRQSVPSKQTTYTILKR